MIIAEQACEQDPNYCVFLPMYKQNVADAREVLQCAQVQRTVAKEKCGPSWFTGSWFEKQKNKVLNWIWGNEITKGLLEYIETVGKWILEKELALFTSAITKITPVANMLLRHAKDGKGELNDENYLEEAIVLRREIVKTSEYQDALKKVQADLGENPGDKHTVGGEYGLFNPDLFFGIKKFDVIAERMPDGTILIIFHDKYDFADGDNPYGIGAWWQNAGLVAPYEINILM